MELVHKEISHVILGSCFEVYNEIGGGHKEKIYQKALSICFGKRSILFKQQVCVDLKVHDQIVGRYFVDFLVSDKVLVEIKSSRFFRMADFRQVTGYLQALNLKLALLIAFTPTGVRYRRVVNLY